MFLPIMAFLLPSATAFLLLHRFWPVTESGRLDFWIKIGLAGPLGVGLASGFYFLWAVLFTPAGEAMVGVELLLYVAAIVWLSFDLRRHRPGWHESLQGGERAPLWGWITLAVVAATGLFAFVNFMFRNPHGLWDAWAIWNLHARFLFRATTFWTDSFSPELFWSSPDYPLAVPGMIANAWKYVGVESLWTPMTMSLLFSAATVVVLVAGLRKLSGGRAAIIGGLCLLGTPLFVTHGASQYADVPVGFFMLAALLCLAFYDSPRWSRPGWLVWAGVFAALAAWTKNEGLMFFVVVIGVRAIIGFVRHGARRTTADLLRIMAGATPILVLLIILKVFLVPANGLFAGQDAAAFLDRLTDPDRYWMILKAFATRGVWFGHGTAAAMVASAIVVWPRFGRVRTTWLAPGIVVVVLMTLGYFMVYLLTPQNLSWYMSVSLHRLLLQLWPSVIFLYSAALSSDAA